MSLQERQARNGAPVRMMVVDDEPDLQALIRQKFRREIREKRYEFLFASDGAEALDVLKSEPDVELVLTDINMPRMDGLTLLTHLRELDQPALKAVIVSAYGDLENIRRAMNEGAFDFLVKPIDLSDLDVTINKTLGELGIIKESLRVQQELTTVQHELEVARRIQQGICPSEWPAFPDRDDIDVFGQMTAARQVGGDFFDFFLLDEDRLGFIIGDVSGKGVPAAIFMAVTRGLLRAVGSQGQAPSECFEEVNKMLCADNDENMFVTAFYGILDTRTGSLEYCSAGHQAPYRLGGGACSELPTDPNLVLGVLSQTTFKTQHAEIAPGERLFLFTDGVTEAMDVDEEFYGDERLAEMLAGLEDITPESVVAQVVASVHEFAKGAAQSDDVTAMAVAYR